MVVDLTFGTLVESIKQIHKQLAAQVGRSVNVDLTIRNWFIGYYIAEFELRGADRAEYGKNLLSKLSKGLKKSGAVEYHPRELKRCQTFYSAYPQIGETLSPEFQQALSGELHKYITSKSSVEKEIEIRGTLSPKLEIPPKILIQNLSFSHFAELIEIDELSKRTFYEIECIRGNWSVRELKRQISSLYYERSGLSKNKKKLAQLVDSCAEKAVPALAIRDPYIFEFLGLKPKEVMNESALEDQLLDNLQEFLLELGNGFCFEARQKRILIGDTYNFVDLVFYHRVLKCHILMELKLFGFSHENIGQLNTYVTWYKKNMMIRGDNPPIGLLLCTQKDHALVEYALAGMDNHLFVSKYQLELPKKEEIEKFLEDQLVEYIGRDSSKDEGINNPDMASGP